MYVAAALFAVDDEVLIGFRQFFERKMNIDFFAGAGAQQILLRFAQFFAAKNTHRALRDAESERSGIARFEIDRDGATETATLGTGA